MNWQTTFERLRRKRIRTWFELGIFLDQFLQQSNRFSKKPPSFSDFSSFRSYLQHGTLGLVTYQIGVDGVSVEIGKYLRAFRRLLGEPYSACVLVGEVTQKSSVLSSEEDVSVHTIEGAVGFERWGELYQQLFHTRLERGGEVYNRLPRTIWQQSLRITEQILRIVEKEKIRCLLPVNAASNPGNLSLTLGLVLVSEVFGIPVINLNHDFYWEDGKPLQARKPGESPGLRDHFFANVHLGEVFSIIRLLYPWNGRSWVHANINRDQTEKLSKKLGINPAAVATLPTSLDLVRYKPLSVLQKEKAFYKLNVLFRSFDPALKIYSCRSEKLLGLASETRPFVIGCRSFEEALFSDKDTLVFLQPTRIIERKFIEDDFAVLEKLMANARYRTFLEKEEKRILLVISGPIASGRQEYFLQLLRRSRSFFQRLPNSLKEKVFVGFKFGKDWNETFLSDGLRDLSMAELYGISSLAFLLSSTEGRGLPIIESAAMGVPMIVRPFHPLKTYKGVIGDASGGGKLNVFEYRREQANEKWVAQVVDVLLSVKKEGRWANANRAVVKQRFSLEVMERSFLAALKLLWLRTRNRAHERRLALESMRSVLKFSRRENQYRELMFARKRTAISGYIPLRYMFKLRSLIDPSHFRVESQELRSRIFSFALEMIEGMNLSEEARSQFFGAVESLFFISWGKEKIGVDHTFTFRHRSRKLQLFRGLTEQELQGVVVRLFKKLFGIHFDLPKELGVKQRYTEWTLALTTRMMGNRTRLSWKRLTKLLASSSWLLHWKPTTGGEMVAPSVEALKKKMLFPFKADVVDDRNLFLRRVVAQPQPLLIFLGKAGENVVELKVLELLIQRWLKKLGFELNDIRNERGNGLPFKIFIALREQPFLLETTRRDFSALIQNTSFSYLKRAWRRGIVQLVPWRTTSSGVNLTHAYKKLVQALLFVRNRGGCVLAKGEDAYVTLDLLDVDSFRFGVVESLEFARFTGLKRNRPFFQYIPAGLRPVLNYPFPTQQAADFSQQIHSLQDQKRLGRRFMTRLKLRADQTGEDLAESSRRLSRKTHFQDYSWHYIAGKHSDGLPWTGVRFKLGADSGKKRKFFPQLVKAPFGKKETAETMARKFAQGTGRQVVAAFNGGYILNAELVGKLGLTEEFIGIPLGLVIDRGRVESLPLFNRPVIGIRNDGSLFVKRLSLPAGDLGLVGRRKAPIVRWRSRDINKQLRGDKLVVYTPMFSGKVSLKDRVLVTICGDRIAAVRRARYKTAKHPQTELLPVGISLSLDERFFEKELVQFYRVGERVRFNLALGSDLRNVRQALEAGPLLVQGGKLAVDMKIEGWLTSNSKKIQASRHDRTDLRGPKIGVGLTKKGELLAVAINSRTRDSFGVGFVELAQILLDGGVCEAMAFDPGGSATLWIDGSVRNIPPFNPHYQKTTYSAPPMARGVANGILITS